MGWEERRRSASCHCAQNAIDSETAFWADEMRALVSEFGHGPGEELGESALVSVCRSASERPHHGARRTPSHATRSCGLKSARASVSTSMISGRSCERFKVDGAKRDVTPGASAAAMGTSDFASAGKDGDAVLLLGRVGEPQCVPDDRGRSRRFHRFGFARRHRAVRRLPFYDRDRRFGASLE